MNNIYWNGVRSFLAVAEHGSFTLASEAIGLSKASLSQQVTQLEEQLDVQLLYRTTRKLRMTEIGERYYEMCRAGVKQITDASDLAAQATDSLTGSIRMNAVGGLIGEELIAPLLIEYQQAHPAIEVKLEFSSSRVDLLENDCDLVLRMGELEDSTLIARKLHTITTRYVAAPSFIASHPKINHPSDLKGLPCISGSVQEWIFARGQQRIVVQAEQGFQISNGRVMCQAAAAGLGIARLADVYTDALIKRGELTEVLSGWQQTTPLWLVSPPTRHQLHRVRELMDFLARNFKHRYQIVLT
ncbi:HTH-type transcriptional regulator DmlR [Pseudovibrio axinellae]|uniref:HTH-type transcriptional regulator DmlR n=1 Tax=Pseudovibrio axinellae TaxID=989403 RepID=A0A165ZGH3_9HYPH|nr:LysR family transcriptional regulator [Pseudovibrio axinellae]KZL19873.1 HTH-type transcriptional regulator DmlR [Pseudovibrio axinellae]SER38574.1 DNA-binding transcriptional regulator, LysR family [Pseudovibrio axinellae]